MAKGECLAKYDDLMRLDAVTVERDGTADLRNPRVLTALQVAAKLPEIWDQIEDSFPMLYNAAGGSYGRIVAVKKLNSSATAKHSKFEGSGLATVSPDGFLWPLVYGFRALIAQNPDGTVAWLTDPLEFFQRHQSEIIRAYMAVMQAFAWDPQNVGKAPLAYQHVTTAFESALRFDTLAGR